MNVRKRILSVIAAAAMLGSACFSAGVPLDTFTAPAAISASAADNGVLSWTESENGVTINGFVDGVTMTSLEIPDTLGGKPVVAIGLTAFREKTELESVADTDRFLEPVSNRRGLDSRSGAPERHRSG